MKSLIFLAIWCLANLADVHAGCGKGMGMNIFPKPGEFPGCFSGLTATETQIDVTRTCIREALAASDEDDDDEEGIDSLEDFMEIADAVSACLVENLELNNGINLDMDKILAEVNSLTGDETLITQLRDITETCFDEIDTTTGDSAEQMLNLMQCKLEAMLEYCTSENKTTGKLALLVPLASLTDVSDCESVNITDTILPKLQTCMETLEIDPCGKGGKGGRGRGGGKRSRGRGSRAGRGNSGNRNGRRNGRSRDRGFVGRAISGMKDRIKDRKCKFQMRKMKKKQEMIEKLLTCMGTELGYLTTENGINFEILGEVVAEFTGWDGVESADIQQNLIDAITECGEQAPFQAEIPEELSSQLPFDTSALSDIAKQRILFSQCFMPIYGDICGLRSQMALFFFPPLSQILPDEMVDNIMGMDKKQMFGCDASSEEDNDSEGN